MQSTIGNMKKASVETNASVSEFSDYKSKRRSRHHLSQYKHLHIQNFPCI